jgi:DNA-binding GntR family transcriptional regulator
MYSRGMRDTEDPAARILSNLEAVFAARARRPRPGDIGRPDGMRPPSFGEWIANQLAGEIISGELPEGSPVRETELALRFRTSRTPIREAIALLWNYGLLDQDARRSHIVKPLTAYDIYAISEARLAIEPLTARLAAARRSEAVVAEIRQLRESFEWAVADDDRFRFFALFPRGRMLTLKACGNPHLSAMYAVIAHRIARLWYLSVEDGEPLQAKWQRLRESQEALLQQDEDRAARAVETSIRHTLASLERRYGSFVALPRHTPASVAQDHDRGESATRAGRG